MPIRAACRRNLTAPTFSAGFRDELWRLLRWRRDVRRFQKTAVDDALLDHLLEMACLAPSVGLSQPWRFVTVNDPARREAVRANFMACNAAALANQPATRSALFASLKLAGLHQAPCQFAVFSVPDPAQGHGLGRMTMPDTTAYSSVTAVHTLWLAARAHGLGLGWVSILDPAAIAIILDVPPQWLLIGYFCLGYPQIADDVPELERAGWEQRAKPEALRLRR